ncbi:MAG: hypothetical protein QM698_07205 [Micropepsaceae bacterium]
MTTEDTNDFDIVATNPAAYYSGPAEVFEDPDLTRAQKLRLLEEWEIDLTRQLESDGEGMAQGLDQADEGRRANDAALLKQVANWRRRALEEDVQAANSTVVGRIWRRIFKGDKAGDKSSSRYAA